MSSPGHALIRLREEHDLGLHVNNVLLLLLLLLLLLKLYSFTLTPSTIADFQGGRDNKKKTMYIIQIKTVNSSTMLG